MVDMLVRCAGKGAGGGRRERDGGLGLGGRGVSFSRAYSRYYTPLAFVICALVC
jgi:hypothetical protein